MTPPNLLVLRQAFHQELCRKVLSIRADQSAIGTKTPVYSNADSHSELSVALAAGMAQRLPTAEALKMNGTASGRAFERTVEAFIEESLPILPGPIFGRMKVEPREIHL